MLKHLLHLNEELDALPKKYAARIEKSIRKNLASALENARLTVTPLGSHQARFTIDVQHAMYPKDHMQLDKDFSQAIWSADDEGHIHLIVDGFGAYGYNFAETVMMSLQPGMIVRAEAFFPTLEHVVTWKNIVKRK